VGLFFCIFVITFKRALFAMAMAVTHASLWHAWIPTLFDNDVRVA
jgi:hypothetical protein